MRISARKRSGQETSNLVSDVAALATSPETARTRIHSSDSRVGKETADDP